MTASWKIFAFAGVALAGAFGAACTVTTNNGDDDGGIFDDFDSGDNGDTGTTTPDGGTTPTCTGREETTEAGTVEITLDSDGGTACDDCMDTSCCSVLGQCFQDPTGDCQNLESCLEACVESPDAGGCTQDCTDLYPDAVALHNAWSDCETTSCTAACE